VIEHGELSASRTVGALEGSVHVVDGVLAHVAQVHAGGEAGGDGGRERAAGAVSFLMQAGVPELHTLSPLGQAVDDDITLA
jgi:hypothetical protein